MPVIDMPDMATTFAAELRRQVMQRGSIAQACLATGINRQQFNKYLAGQMVPHSLTMRKICRYLGVSEEQLISGRAPPAGAFAPIPDIDWGAHAPTPAGRIHTASEKQQRHAVLRNGCYRCYYPVHGHPGLLARWLMHVWQGPDGHQLHTCRNRFDNAAELGFSAARIRYRGPVIHGLGEVCLIGNTRSPQPLSGVISINLRPVDGTDYYTSMVLTRRPSGPLALSGPVHYLGPSCVARRALSTMGVIHRDDPELDPVIRRLLSTPSVAGDHWMQPAMAETLPAGLRPEGSKLLEKQPFRRRPV